MRLRTFFAHFLESHCDLCLMPLSPEQELCETCQNQLPDFLIQSLSRPAPVDTWLDGLYSGWTYQGNTQRIFERIKFANQRNLLRFLCSRAVLPEISFDLMTWVPLSFRRLKERGFNQSKQIVKMMAEPGIKTSGVLSRRHTEKQSLKNREARFQALNDSPFRIRKSAEVKGKNILLVDDILTTGATLAACARVLKESGAETVYGFTLAHAELRDEIRR